MLDFTEHNLTQVTIIEHNFGYGGDALSYLGIPVTLRKKKEDKVRKQEKKGKADKGKLQTAARYLIGPWTTPH